MTIQQHKHCVMCDKAIAPDRRVCSPRCERMYADRLKKAKRYNTITRIALIVMISITFFIILSNLIGP
ncbi:MAG: DUF2116 family Zn-ribbon domain-containing protein [Candidatus Methanofastidiosia archaeon]